MKKILAILALALAAQAPAQAATAQDVCLSLAGYAKAVAESRERNMPEADVIARVTEPTVKKSLTAVIQFVYTMELDPANARKLVFLKCQAGEFWSK